MSSLWLVPVADGEPRELVRAPAAAAPAPGAGRVHRGLDTGEPRSRDGPEIRHGHGTVARSRGVRAARKLDIDISESTLSQGAGPAGGFAL